MEQTFGCWVAFPCDCGDHFYCLRLRENCEWKMTSKQAPWISECHSAQCAGRGIFLLGRKSMNRQCVFRIYLARTVQLLRHETSKLGQRTKLPESGHCVSLHLPSLVNTFLGHTVTTHEEAGCECVSESAGSHTVAPSQGYIPVQMEWACGEELRSIRFLKISQRLEQS